MKYNCQFDFTVVKKGSNFIGKSGEVEIETDKELDNEQNLKTDKAFQNNIATHLATTMKQKNIFMVTIKNIVPFN